MKTSRIVIRLIFAEIMILCALSTSTFAQEGGEERGSERLRERAKIYEPLMAEAAERHGIDPRLLWTIAYLESRFRPQLVSPKGARGMMQFMPATAARYKLTNPHDARQSIEAASRYLHDLTAKFGNHVDLVLAAYNAGEGAVESYLSGVKLMLGNGKVINATGLVTGGIPPYRETQNYVETGLEIFTGLRGRDALLGINRRIITALDRIEKLEALRENSFYPASAEDEGQPERPSLDADPNAGVLPAALIINTKNDAAGGSAKPLLQQLTPQPSTPSSSRSIYVE